MAVQYARDPATGTMVPVLGGMSQEAADARYLQKSGGTMTGDIVLKGAPSALLHPATKQYTDTADGLLLPKSGGTMTGNLETDSRIRDGKHGYVMSRGFTGAETGFMLIELPATAATNMCRINLHGYNYSAASGFELLIGGYTYTGSPDAIWVNYGARLYGGEALYSQLSAVRFLAKGTATANPRHAIAIGSAAAAWNYLQVHIECFAYHAAQAASLTDPWVFSVVTAIPAAWTWNTPVTAASVSTVYYGTAAPSGSGYKPGDIYCQYV